MAEEWTWLEIVEKSPERPLKVQIFSRRFDTFGEAQKTLHRVLTLRAQSDRDRALAEAAQQISTGSEVLSAGTRTWRFFSIRPGEDVTALAQQLSTDLVRQRYPGRQPNLKVAKQARFPWIPLGLIGAFVLLLFVVTAKEMGSDAVLWLFLFTLVMFPALLLRRWVRSR